MKPSILNSLFILSLLLLFIGTLFFPIFNDEIGYFILRNRLALDEEHIILQPQCGKEAFTWSPPLAWYPINLLRYLTGLLVENPLQIRLLGIAKMLINLSLILFCASMISKIRQDKLLQSHGIIWVFASVGSLIWIMSINRPEQTLLMGYLGILSILLYGIHNPSISIRRDLLALGVVSLSSILLFSSHVKAFGFIPFAVFAVISSLSKRTIRVVGLIVLTGVAISSTSTYLSLSTCPEDAFLSFVLKNWVVNPISIFTEPMVFFERTLTNVSEFSLYLYGVMVYRHTGLPIEWIKTIDFEWSDFFLSIINPIWVLILSTISIEAMWGSLKRDSSLNRLKQVGVLSLLGLILISGFQSRKLFYESSFYIPILILTWAMVRSHQFPRLVEELQHRFNILKYTATLTSITLTITCLPMAFSDTVGKSQSHDSFYWYDFFKQTKNIEETAKLCGIDTNAEQTHLVVDDLTYFSFKRLKKPFHVLYVGHPWGKGVEGRLVDFLASWGSSGVVAQCNYVPYELKEIATQGLGNICCIGKEVFSRAD